MLVFDTCLAIKLRRDRELHLPYTCTIACSYNVPSQIKRNFKASR